MEVEKDAAPLAAQLVGEAESFAGLLQKIPRVLPACALKEVVCLLLLKPEGVTRTIYRGCSVFFLWETKRKKTKYSCLCFIAWRSAKLQAGESK